MWFNETEIYKKAIEVNEVVREATSGMPAGYAFLRDQLVRAAASVVLNYCEGFAKRTPRDRRRFFDQARGSAVELVGGLDVGVALGVVRPALRDRGVELAGHVASMLRRFR